MPPENEKHDRLRKAGLIGDEVHPDIEVFIAEHLEDEEVDALVSIKEKLDAQEIPVLTLAPDPGGTRIMFMPIL